jgi:uncharacterized protein (TIGR02145 family)
MKKILISITLCILIVSCKKVQELNPDFIYVMTLSQEAVNFAPAGGTAKITLSSNYQWTTEIDQSWLTLSKAEGTAGNAEITLTATQNTKIEERVANVTVTAGAVVRTIKVVQLNPDGFEIVGFQPVVNTDGLENVVELVVKTNMKLAATSAADWIVDLQNSIVSGNPPKEAKVRILVKDNTSGANREANVTINGVGLPASYAKTFKIVQTQALAASTSDTRVIGTWIIGRVAYGSTTDFTLLGAIMKFTSGGVYEETLPSGATSTGTWNVRGDRAAIYYSTGQRRYIYLTSATSDEILGQMTTTDVASTVIYDTRLTTYSGDAFGLSILEKTNTTITYMILINSDMGLGTVTERGICISKNANPTISDKKYTGSTTGSVIVGKITGLSSGETYNLRAYQKNTTNQVYTANIVSLMPIKDIDGNSYTITRIGTQVWMAQNLKTTKFRDGTPIAYFDKTQNAGWAASGSAQTPAYCWIFGEGPSFVYTADTWNQGTDKVAKTYGAYYNWYTASDKKNLAPEGWHVPTKAEYITLIAAVGGDTQDFGASLAFKNGLLAHDHYQNLYGWNGWSVNQRGPNGDWNMPGTTIGSHECGWWSSENSDAGYPWMIYSRRGDTGDGGISWSYANEGNTIRVVRDTENPL